MNSNRYWLDRPSMQFPTDPAPVGDDAELRDEERAESKRREEERREQNELNRIYRG